MVSTAQDIMSRYGIDQDFAASIESLGNDLGVDPMYLANTMYAESRLDPSVKNMAGSGATGLIQFMPQTAANLGTTTDELSRMTPVEQMEYVRRYFSADNLGAGRLRDLQNDPSQHNVNMAVFLPSMIGKPVDTQIPQEYFRQNGSIRTPADYTRSAEERVNAYIQSNPADTQADTVDTQTDKMLSKEQPEDTFRPENDSVSSDTGVATGDQAEEVLEVDDTLMAEHEEKIRRGEAPRGSKPTEEGGYYTEGEYGFRTNPEGEVVADLEVNSLENVATSVGERLRTILGNNEDSETLELNEGGLVESARAGVYSLGSRGAARELRDTVAKELGVYETSEEARSIANKYGLNVKETDTLRHILGAGLLKYIDKDFTQPLLQGTEVLDKLQVSLERLMDPNSEDIYRKSYYVQSIEEANRDIVNYQVGAALAKQFDKKDDFINSAVKLVKELGKGKNPVVVDKMPSEVGLFEIELTPQLSTGVVYNPDELKKRRVVYDPETDTMVSSRTDLSPPIPEPRPDPSVDYELNPLLKFYDPEYDASPPIPELRPKNLKKAKGGSVEKEVEFVKEDDDDVPDPPPGATPEEVADDIPAYLSTGEYVLPANVVRYIGLKNITDLHQRALAELQQMEDLDIIENVDENGYVEEDDDEMDYMKPEGVVEIVVAEHHPKGLMAMELAEGGPVEAMVYVPGVGFVPQTQAAYLSSKKDEDKDEEQEDTDKSILEGGESQGDTNDVSEGGPTGKGYGSLSEMVNDPSFQSQATAVAGLFGTPLAVDIATGALKGFQEQFGFSDAPSPGETFGGDVESMGIGGTEAAAQAAAASQMDAQAAENEAQSGDSGDTGNDTGGTETGAAESVGGTEGEAETGAGSSWAKGGYVSKKGIMARGYSEGGEAGDTAGESGGYGGAEAGDEGGGMGGPGGTDERVEDLESEVEEEKPTDPYEGYTYVKGIGYVPTSRRMTSDKPVDSASLALSSIFTPGFLETIGLMNDPNKEL
jgi:hypothetical protein